MREKDEAGFNDERVQYYKIGGGKDEIEEKTGLNEDD